MFFFAEERTDTELREIPLSLQTVFNLVSAAVVCAILESISGLEPSSVITEPRYLKLMTVSSFCPFTLISLLMLVLFVITLVFSALNCLQTDTEDDHPILRKDVEAVVQSLKKGKSAGVNNIPAELA